MIPLLIIIGVIILVIIFLCRQKKLYYDTIVMINGANGTGKTSFTIWKAKTTHKKVHRIWWRRVHIWSKLKPKLKNEEEPLLYCNIPVYDNINENKLYKYYVPLTKDILQRKARPRYKSIIVWDESSIMATSMDYKDKELSESMHLFMKLVRHEVKGSYRNLFDSNATLFINTQSKNDNHYAVDRTCAQSLYLIKAINIPFFRLTWVRDLLIIDGVQNDFEEDVKESSSTRMLWIPKKVFKWYDSYSYEFLTHDLPVLDNNNCKCRIINENGKRIFEIATFHNWQEIEKSNQEFKRKINQIEQNRKEQKQHVQEN